MEHAAAPVAPAPAPGPVVETVAVAASPVASADADRAPRKRRRRRSGKRIEGADNGSTATAQAPVRQPPPSQVVATRVTPKSTQPVESSLLSRIGRGLKSLVKRAPRSQH